jgi:squalene-hopene/tetraprenyl-beta-curcumene cyclase
MVGFVVPTAERIAPLIAAIIASATAADYALRTSAAPIRDARPTVAASHRTAASSKVNASDMIAVGASYAPTAFYTHKDIEVVSNVVKEEIGLAAEAEIRLQVGWPEDVRLGLWQQSAWYELPYAFLPAFPMLDIKDIRPLAVFGRLFANSIFIHDPLADRAVAPHEVATTTLRIMAMQFEAYHLLHPLLPADAPFWNRFKGYMSDYARACITEMTFASGSQAWREFSETLALETAIGKSGPSRAIIAALVDLARDESLLEPLLDALNHFNIACQMWDDLNDWKDDLNHGMPSLLLRRLLAERPSSELSSAEMDRLGREIYYKGHAQYVLDLALTSLDAADKVRSLVPDLPWYHSIDVMRTKYRSVQRDIGSIMTANLERVRKHRNFTLVLPEAMGPWQDVAWSGMQFIVRQWKLGFGEARDIVATDSLISHSDKLMGDIFQRAQIVDVLCDVEEIHKGSLLPVINDELAYLLKKRRITGFGGWTHFHDVQVIPPDAETLAQIIRAFLRCGRRECVVMHCESSIRVLLRDDASPVRTWLIETSVSPSSPLEMSLGHSLDEVHEEVIANICHALCLYDRPCFESTIRDGVRYLEGQQGADGSWKVTWSHGPYYAIYQCVRLFAAAHVGARAIERAMVFLRNNQRSDGGWGVNPDDSDPLSTALALLALAEGRCSTDLERAVPARRYLQRSQYDDGSWSSRKLISRGWDAFTGSKTLTTSFVIKAALVWDQILHNIQNAKPIFEQAL